MYFFQIKFLSLQLIVKNIPINSFIQQKLQLEVVQSKRSFFNLFLLILGTVKLTKGFINKPPVFTATFIYVNTGLQVNVYIG